MSDNREEDEKEIKTKWTSFSKQINFFNEVRKAMSM